MNKKTEEWTVTITDEERAAEWQAVLGTTTVRVISPLVSRATIPGRVHAPVFWLDLSALTLEQRESLVAHISRKFNMPANDVIADFSRDPVHAVPILADHCIAPAIQLRLIL